MHKDLQLSKQQNYSLNQHHAVKQFTQTTTQPINSGTLNEGSTDIEIILLIDQP